MSGEWLGPVWTFTLWLPTGLTPVNDAEAPLGEFAVDPTNLGFFLDGESRAFALELCALDAADPARRRALLDIPVAV